MFLDVKLQISSSTVHNIIKRFRETGEISVRKGQGRRPLLDARRLQALHWLVWFEILLVFILFKFKKRPNISKIRVVHIWKNMKFILIYIKHEL